MFGVMELGRGGGGGVRRQQMFRVGARCVNAHILAESLMEKMDSNEGHVVSNELQQKQKLPCSCTQTDRSNRQCRG